MKKYYSLTILVCLLIITTTITTTANPDLKNLTILKEPPTPPEQPTDGPGGSNYTHHAVKRTRYGFAAKQYWIFEPQEPTPETAPVIVFNHGWSAFYPFYYQSWVNHIVRRGNIVIYPRYQFGLTIGFRYFSDNAIQAVKQAITELQTGPHVQPNLDKFAIVGHSLGGGITANMAAQAQKENLPIPKAIMPVQPAIPYTADKINYSTISNQTLMLVIVGENDTIVGNHSGLRIYYEADSIPISQKDYVIQVTDTYGSPPLIADHIAPVAPRKPFDSMVDAMDFYSTWKLFDALTDYAFYGINQEYCLGNTSEQRFMGLWSDGTPVKELVITDTP